LGNDELGAAAKQVPSVRNKTAASNTKAILKQLAFIVFLQDGF
jgi:hypothetical protein